MSQSCGQRLIEILESAGITDAFGIPGVHNLELYRGIAGSSIRHVTSRHEQGAAFMADGYARVTGRPALVLPISGPGLLNAATAIGQAYSDSVPMLIVATNNPVSTLGLGGGELHETRNQSLCMQGILDTVLSVNHPAQLEEVLAQALERLRSSRPRPVYIELPIDVASQPASGAAQGSHGALQPRIVPASNEDARRLGEAVNGAQRLAMIVGGGARGASDLVRSIAEKTGALVVSSIAGKGIVPDDGPAGAGAFLGDDAVQALLSKADCVLAIGTELAMPDRWRPLPPMTGTLVRIDIDPAQLARPPFASLRIQADARAALQALEAALKPGRREPWFGDLAAIRGAAAQAYRQRRPQELDILAALRETLADDGIVATDMTQIAYGGNLHFPCRTPGSWLHPVGYGTLGYGLPAAIGAKLALPERQVVSLSGDYGFGFTSNELAVAASHGLCLPVIVWNNHRLGQIQDDMDRLNIARIGVEIEPPSLELIAKAHGAGYVAPADIAAFKAALKDALETPRPVVIEMRDKA